MTDSICAEIYSLILLCTDSHCTSLLIKFLLELSNSISWNVTFKRAPKTSTMIAISAFVELLRANQLEMRLPLDFFVFLFCRVIDSIRWKFSKYCPPKCQQMRLTVVPANASSEPTHRNLYDYHQTKLPTQKQQQQRIVASNREILIEHRLVVWYRSQIIKDLGLRKTRLSIYGWTTRIDGIPSTEHHNQMLSDTLATL